ncbi:MAG: hypothetical protein KGM15_01015 [Pseudomonadota bacterium]|nr:hypothetical protein [Pseudomonadota bacterium]
MFWSQLRLNEGLCRRHPPPSSWRSEEVAHWPQTHSRQVCGEGLVAATRPGATCARCLFWRRPDGGLNPVDRGDMLKSWWAKAGLCVRDAPRPTSEPGPRAFWRATADVEGCGDGVEIPPPAAAPR